MEKFLRIIGGASTWTGKLASFLVVLLILAIGYDITVRECSIADGQLKGHRMIDEPR